MSSAFFGAISGSSVADTITTGALTIPNSKRPGYPGYFAGGQITPPVCISAHAAAAIAGSTPFRTGISASTPRLGKVVVPMAFVCAPVLLCVSSTGFHLREFGCTAASCIAGVIALSAAVIGYWLAPMGAVFRVLMALAGLVFFATSLQADLAALVICGQAALRQVVTRRAANAAV